MFSLLEKRRSIRSYLPTEIPSEIIQRLKETALRSPTSRNRKEWKFWFITDPEKRHLLAESKASGSAMIAEAPLIIVIGADESLCDVWIEDCSIATILMQMVAQENEIGSVWVQIRNRFTQTGEPSEQRVKSILGVTEQSYRIESIIAMGYRAEEKDTIPRELLQWDAIQE